MERERRHTKNETLTEKQTTQHGTERRKKQKSEEETMEDRRKWITKASHSPAKQLKKRRPY